MAMNPHSLRPSELARILNSSELGEVVSRDRIYRQRDKAGLRICDGRGAPAGNNASNAAGNSSGASPRSSRQCQSGTDRIDIVRYTAWLLWEWRGWREKQQESMTRSDRHRVDEAMRLRAKRESIRNIGPVPRIKDIERREACRKDLAKFLMTYAPEGKNPYSEDHLRVIKRIENAIFHGGRFVEAVYRGFGKSTISRVTAVWALLYGHRRFIPVVGCNAARAEENLDAIKGILESPRLCEDFPEVCFAVQALEGITQRCHGQMFETREREVLATHLEWGSDFLVLPMTDGAFDENGEWHANEAAGSCILACGITSSKLRGMNKRRGDGVELRPDFVIIDDPQDEESAASPQQVTKRLNIIKKAILRSAGHTEGMSVVMPCTVIQKDDLVDQLLDPKKNPAWQGERIPFVRKWSDAHETSWLEEYRRIRTSYNPEDPDEYLRARREATAFYLKNRETMDKGCVVSWEFCFTPEEDEVSAIQHAYNALIDDGEEVFASEFQNEPFLPPEEEGQLTRDEIHTRLNNMKRGEIPDACEKVTAFIDVQGKALYYVVVAWTPDFTGYVIDYGIFPDQHRRHVTLRQITRTLQQKFPGTGQEGAWRAGFEALSAKLIGREWKRDDGTVLHVSRLLIDANDGNASGTVYDFCRQSAHASVVMPSRGKGVTASAMPFSDYRKKRGDRVSEFNWRIPAVNTRSAVRYILFDTNYWKSFVRSRWRVAMGDPGSLSIFGKQPEQHRMFTDQMVSEYSVRTEGRGRVVDEWQIRPNASDNHLFDCLVGCAVAASEQGVVLPGTGGTVNRKKPRIKLSELQRR